MAQPDPRLTWVDFFEKFASKLLDYRNRRGPLITAVQNALREVESEARFDEEDICPFTVMALMNRGNTKWPKRIMIAESLNRDLDMGLDLPADFHGVPVVQTQQWWFFDYASGRESGDIEALWQVFEDALKLHEADSENTRAAFGASFDIALRVEKTGLKTLPMGLYWIRPNSYVALDTNNLRYIERHFPHSLASKASKARKGNNYNNFSGSDYLELRKHVLSSLDEMESPVRSIPDLSYAAWHYSRGNADIRIIDIGQQLSDEGEFTSSNEPEARDKIDTSIARRRGQHEFRNKLLDTYGKRCAITGCDAVEALEAAHIRQYKEADLNDATNGLLLRADIHTLFDRHLIGIDPVSGNVWIGELLKGTTYAELVDTEARPPKKKDRPDPDALREHREEAKRLGRFN